jgi:hypothetical protein
LTKNGLDFKLVVIAGKLIEKRPEKVATMACRKFHATITI